MKYLKEFYRFVKHIIENKKLILTLSRNDFKKQYLGSYLGILWAILRPSLFIFVVWFVFGMGFKSKPTNDGVPFFIWLLCGIIPWFFFVDSVTKGMSAIISNAYLVKKVAFRVSILPLVKVFSSLGIHLIMVVLLIVVLLSNNFYPTVYWFQLPYYIFCIFILAIGLGWLTSALRVFVKDTGEVIGVIVQFGFWLTPIFWSLKIIPEEYHYLVKLNPMVYVIEGFRNTFIYNIWFWEAIDETVQFWIESLMISILGAIIFKRLRPHFGDVL